jgi:hypothetical protein
MENQLNLNHLVIVSNFLTTGLRQCLYLVYIVFAFALPIPASAVSIFKHQSQCNIFYGETPLRPMRASSQLYGVDRQLKPNNKIWGEIYDYRPTGLTLQSKETRVLNQGGTKECPTFAFVHALENAYANHAVNPVIVEIDPSYIVASKLRRYAEKAIDPDPSFLTEMDAEAPMREGGEFHNVLDLTLRYGLVPKARWEPIQPITEWPFNTLSPEHSLYARLSKQIDEFNADITKGSVIKVDKSDLGYSEWKRQTAKNIVNNILGSYLGQWPRPFEWQGKFNTTPVTFAYQIGPSRTQVPKLIYMTQFPYAKDEWSNRLIPYFGNFINSKEPFLHSQLSQKQFYDSILTGLRESKGVVIDMDGQVVIENGIAKRYGHAFAVVDVEVQNNQVVALKLKNSFENWGINGHAWFSIDEITPQTRRAWIFGLQ